MGQELVGGYMISPRTLVLSVAGLLVAIWLVFKIIRVLVVFAAVFGVIYLLRRVAKRRAR